MMKRSPSKMFRNSLRHVAVALPGEREALDAVRVGVLRRGEPAAVERELAQHVVDGLLGDLAVALLADHLEAVEVRDGEQRVVVEHLLEVRHEPLVVDRVAVEAAADESYMPPSAILSSVVSTRSTTPRRSRNSSVGEGGNLGAPPQPPHSQSNVAIRFSSAP